MKNNAAQISVQEDIIEYFKDVSDAIIIDIIKCFVYGVALEKKESKAIFDKFISDNGIQDAYINYLYDTNNPQAFFSKSSMSQVSIIEKVKIGMLNMVFNRFKNNNLTEKEKDKKNKKNFNFLKNHLLDCYESLNRNDNYFYGEEEDEKMVDKIENLKFES